MNTGTGLELASISVSHLRWGEPLANKHSFILLVSLVIIPSAFLHAQWAPATPAQIVRALPAPLPVEVRPFSTGAPDPHSPLAEIRSQTHLNCVKKQLSEVQKVADAAGGNESLARQMGRIPVIFEILSNDTTSGKPSRLRPGLSRGMEPQRVIWLLTNIVSINPKTHQVQCEFVPAERIISWLEKDINHPVKFATAARPGRGGRSAAAR